MMRTWPPLAHRARASALELGQMVRTWPSWVRTQVLPYVSVVRTWPSSVRGRMPARLLGEVALAALLLSAVAFSPRDGAPVDDPVAWPTEPATRLVAATMEPTSIGLTLPGMSNFSTWAKSTGSVITAKALIPTAPPVQLLIPSMRVNRPVEKIGVNRYGVLDLPVNGWNAGWYKDGPVPGAPGDAVIQGHAGLPGEPMLFGNLYRLKQGDKIIIVLADGSRRLFLVQSMSIIPIGVAPPGIADPSGPPRLTLLTCTGNFDKEKKYYTQRLVLEASYAGTA